MNPYSGGKHPFQFGIKDWEKLKERVKDTVYETGVETNPFAFFVANRIGIVTFEKVFGTRQFVLYDKFPYQNRL